MEMATTPVFLPGESHGWRSLVGYSPRVAKSRTRLSDFTFTFTFLGMNFDMRLFWSNITLIIDLFFFVQCFGSNCIRCVLVHVTFEKEKRKLWMFSHQAIFFHIISNQRIESGSYVLLYSWEEIMPLFWQTESGWFGWKITTQYKKNMIIKC